MKIFVSIVSVFTIVLLLQFFITCNKKTNNEAMVKALFYQQIDTLFADINELKNQVNKKDNLAQIQAQFAKSRNSFKQIEPIIEYCYQGLAKRINGAALPDIKTEDGQVFPPHGFQVIEQALFSNYTDSMASLVLSEINVLEADLYFAKANLKEISILPHHVYEMLQHQLIRIAAQGLAGFDAPLSKYSLAEIQHNLIGIEKIYKAYYTPKKWSDSLNILYAATKNYLKNNTDFDSFDRLHFTTTYLMPVSTFIASAYEVDDTMYNKPFSGTLADLLKGQKLNADYYAAYDISKTNLNKIALGKLLFYDSSLSKSNAISCGSCHKPRLYFTDGKVKANNFVHGGSLDRNTPTLLYASLQSHQFYDARSTTLEDQINEVFKNTNEFNFNANSIAKKVASNTNYALLFKKAFVNTDSITGYEVRNAISSYVRSLSPFTSRFDEYMRGNETTINKEEKAGFNLFMGKAKCGTCHFMPLFNGNIPPWYSKSESEIIGVPEKAIWANAKIDKDEGRYNINKMQELQYAFKTPTIRNVEKTAPYMHNGVYSNLNDVVAFYTKGGGVGIGMVMPFQTLPFDSLMLNSSEEKAIVAFMKTLTDKKVDN